MAITPIKQEAEADVIEELEKALELAKAGKLRTIVLVGAFRGGDHYISYSTDNIYDTVGAIENMKFRLLASSSILPMEDV